MITPKNSSIPEKILITFVFAAFLFLLTPPSSEAYTEGTWWQNETSHWTAGTNQSIEVGSQGTGNYIKLTSGSSSGWWQSSSKNWGETVVFSHLRTDSEVTAGGIDVTVEVSDDGFSTVKDSLTKSLVGGSEIFDMSTLSNAQYVRVNVSFSSTNSDKELTTLHELRVNVSGSSVCTVNDVDIDLRDPGGDTTGWFGSTYSSSSGTCGTSPDVTETWENTSGYSYCPLEGSYDGRRNAYTENEEATNTFSWETSSWASGVYSVDYDSSTDWCGCGANTEGYNFNWLSAAENANDGSYPRCCGDESRQNTYEIWETGANGNGACVDGQDLSDGGVSSSMRYVDDGGHLRWCKVPDGGGDGYGWTEDFSECSFVSTSQGDMYCGAGGTDKEGEWHTLLNSGCQLVQKIRGGRIIVH